MGDSEAPTDLRPPTDLGPEEMLRMFDEAWDSLSAEEQAEIRREREDWFAAWAQHDGRMSGA